MIDRLAVLRGQLDGKGAGTAVSLDAPAVVPARRSRLSATAAAARTSPAFCVLGGGATSRILP